MAKGWDGGLLPRYLKKVGGKMMTKLNWTPLSIKETAEVGHEFAKFVKTVQKVDQSIASDPETTNIYYIDQGLHAKISSDWLESVSRQLGVMPSLLDQLVRLKVLSSTNRLHGFHASGGNGLDTDEPGPIDEQIDFLFRDVIVKLNPDQLGIIDAVSADLLHNWRLVKLTLDTTDVGDLDPTSKVPFKLVVDVILDDHNQVVMTFLDRSRSLTEFLKSGGDQHPYQYLNPEHFGIVTNYRLIPGWTRAIWLLSLSLFGIMSGLAFAYWLNAIDWVTVLGLLLLVWLATLPSVFGLGQFWKLDQNGNLVHYDYANRDPNRVVKQYRIHDCN